MRTRPDTVHGTRFQVDKDGTRHILALVTFIVVDIDALQLELHQVLISTSVFTSGLDAMFITDDFPELKRKKYGLEYIPIIFIKFTSHLREG